MDLDNPMLLALRGANGGMPAPDPAIGWEDEFAPAHEQMERAGRVSPVTDQARPANQLSGGTTDITHGDHGPAQIIDVDMLSPQMLIKPVEALDATPTPDWPDYNAAGQGGEHAAPLGVVG